jgi:ATP-dependent RNA helicase RhlE
MDDLNLIPGLAAAAADMGYTRPTPIQGKAIPVVLAGRDLIACAATGTGKTAAFLLPILQRLHAGQPAGCRALILSPTRELALQIDEQALAFGYYLGLSAVAVVGGTDMGPQERGLRDGSDIVVATPGRLLDHMRFRYVDLTKIEVLVLDEADRMLDMGFLPDIQRILAALPATRQTLLFSATMSPKIRELAGNILRDPVKVTVDHQRPATGISGSVCWVAQERKTALLSALLRHDGMRSVLVFVRRKADADRLARAVTRGGVDATSIHSDRSQPERVAALEAFRRGQCPVLIATDVAARGLDVDGISHVINFDVPHSPDDYIHRAGRTARAGALGDVITFVCPEEEDRLEEIQKMLGAALPRRVVPGFDTVTRGSPGESGRGGPPHHPGRHRTGRPSTERRGERAIPAETPLAAKSGDDAPANRRSRRRSRASSARLS